MRTDYQCLLVEQDGGVLTVTMNRPEKLNAFDNTMLQELTEVIEAAAQDEAVRCLVITGAGRAFGSGQDLTTFAARSATAGPFKVSQHLVSYHRLVFAIRNAPKPVVAAVHGVAAGISCNIALACDMRIAADNARFIEAFARIGLVPDGGGGFFLPRLVGMGKDIEKVGPRFMAGPFAEGRGSLHKVRIDTLMYSNVQTQGAQRRAWLRQHAPQHLEWCAVLISHALQQRQEGASRSVLVLGAGACTEVPLGELARASDEVMLADLDRTAIQRGWDELASPVLRKRVRLLQCDMSDGISLNLSRLIERQKWAALVAQGAEAVFDAAARCLEECTVP